jgi:hypothetical protein
MGADDDLVQAAQKLVPAGYQAMLRTTRSVGVPNNQLMVGTVHLRTDNSKAARLGGVR